jgi:hypothetical protein
MLLDCLKNQPVARWMSHLRNQSVVLTIHIHATARCPWFSTGDKNSQRSMIYQLIFSSWCNTETKRSSGTYLRPQQIRRLLMVVIPFLRLLRGDLSQSRWHTTWPTLLLPPFNMCHPSPLLIVRPTIHLHLVRSQSRRLVCIAHPTRISDSLRGHMWSSLSLGERSGMVCTPRARSPGKKHERCSKV